MADRDTEMDLDETLQIIGIGEFTALFQDYKHYVMLSLMGSLLPYKSRHVFGSKQWKPKIADCKEGIVLKVELAGDVETAVATKIEKLQSVEVPFFNSLHKYHRTCWTSFCFIIN
ncbi:uncharacterized protein LOC116181960 [Photinus pyralis]|uniref:uncharacterized protein LOC116159473 n=1 Tax=Photinus pyralis TaxID=7054 RepID=UPI0012673F79|nr:uncharacterized protein LOC116159473 [Photinus pyralis]XP_031328310.1 uncharacterized protein LOC116159473 [Photinus pyralis]XP_031341365.1 uncharacterized protein LOC116169419 [Photinus pyralis]XP_031358271.1 uncharacterized protein LOC116181960 [Photinus pyralis]XP_031358272.1 uncharacterized protein LOC116181960 [Photinus pyralis]